MFVIVHKRDAIYKFKMNFVKTSNFALTLKCISCKKTKQKQKKKQITRNMHNLE